MLEIRSVHKSFHDGEGEISVLDGVDLKIQAGESVALLGDSGSGKSTFLQIAAGLDAPDAGEVYLGNKALSDLRESQLAQLRRRDIGFVFQQFNLVPGLDTQSNLLFQRRLNELPDDDPWVTDLIDGLELGALLNRPVSVLSGGQQQRLAIGRALAHRPGMIFADEPTGNLHDALSQQVMTLLQRFVEEVGAALLLVTHNQRLARFTQRQFNLSEGRLVPLVDNAH